jgi:hypothetical protein
VIHQALASLDRIRLRQIDFIFQQWLLLFHLLGHP